MMSEEQVRDGPILPLYIPYVKTCIQPKLLPLGFLEIHVTIETGGNHKERHFQFKALRGDGVNRLW